MKWFACYYSLRWLFERVSEKPLTNLSWAESTLNSLTSTVLSVARRDVTSQKGQKNALFPPVCISAKEAVVQLPLTSHGT